MRELERSGAERAWRDKVQRYEASHRTRTTQKRAGDLIAWNSIGD